MRTPLDNTRVIIEHGGLKIVVEDSSWDTNLERMVELYQCALKGAGFYFHELNYTQEEENDNT